MDDSLEMVDSDSERSSVSSELNSSSMAEGVVV